MPLCYCIKKQFFYKTFNCTNHNHDSKLIENIQNILTELKRRLLTDVDQTIGKVDEEQVKKFVSILTFH